MTRLASDAASTQQDSLRMTMSLLEKYAMLAAGAQTASDGSSGTRTIPTRGDDMKIPDLNLYCRRASPAALRPRRSGPVRQRCGVPE